MGVRSLSINSCLLVSVCIIQIILVFIGSNNCEELLEYRQYRRNQDPRDKGVRFGYQNPLLVAPTLAPGWSQHSTTFRYQEGGYDYDQLFITSTPNRGRLPFGGSRCPENSGQDQSGRRLVDWRLDKKTQKCFPLGSTEPCRGSDSNMAFYGLPNDPVYGECDCIRNQRPLVYHSKTDTCYYIYQQGYCPPSTWLVVNNLNKPVCERNPCLDYGKDVANWDFTMNVDSTFLSAGRGIVPIYKDKDNGICVALGSVCLPDGSYKSRRVNNNNEKSFSSNVRVLAFHGPNALKPTCQIQKNIAEERLSSNNFLMDCRTSGSKLDVTGRC